ncbi:hypothetical protein OVA06_14440 [Pseudarthrobacter sp. SL88]|uniref:hypothetical protein n=1 Tax=Pseudarthrobacter sp. SL88 TaxID=2994666 RepID=UPI002275E6F6|nr:hypothetical protein [Pseudarthrobacter sp. SL88]MCY1675888.1 hypothetical protein [Pseudarthrobacter sp. SL88]
MKLREIWGSVLLAAAAVCTWVHHVLSEAYRAATREGLLLYMGIPADSIASWFLIVAFLSGPAGLMLLLPALIRRIPRKVPRRIVGWSAGVAAAAAVPYLGVVFVFAALGAFGVGDTVKITAVDGQSVLVTQDGFDGDSVAIYGQHDGFHYKRVRDASEISGWPRVKDRGCRLETAGGPQLVCGTKMVAVRH